MEGRLEEILTLTIREYIQQAAPIGSRFIAQKYHPRISPATIRNEFSALTREGYLQQPHPSAGRIPTNRGWRFYAHRVVEVMERKVALDSEVRDVRPELDSYRAFIAQKPHSLEEVAHAIARTCHALGVCIDERGDMFFGGLSELFSQPDFETRDQFEELAGIIERLERKVEAMFDHLVVKAPDILIGRENRYLANDDISSLFTRFETENNVQGLMLVVGPKRMPYARNWQLLKMFAETAQHITI